MLEDELVPLDVELEDELGNEFGPCPPVPELVLLKLEVLEPGPSGPTVELECDGEPEP